MVRPTETRELTAEGESLEAIAQAFRAQTPDGWELLSSPVTMPKGTTAMKASGVIGLRAEVREIEADDMATLEAKVPDGWQLLSVRRV